MISKITSLVKHPIDDTAGDGDTELVYSADKIVDLLSDKSDSDHIHDDRYYTEAEIDNLLSSKSDVGHTHDDRYYTEAEMDSLLSNKSDVGHTHDDRYYTETEMDLLLANKQDVNTVLTALIAGSVITPMINKTGAVSVKGTIVQNGSVVENSFELGVADGNHPIGVVYENGVADGDSCYIVTCGLADVLLEDGTAATNGYWARTSENVAGRADLSNQFPPGGTISALEAHLCEIGHCTESASSGTDVLARCVIHFL